MKRTVLVALAACLALGVLPAATLNPQLPTPPPHPPKRKEHRDARMKWWREAKFGMFIHWGVYAVPAGDVQGQAVRPHRRVDHARRAKFPVAEYREYAKQFNPVKYDPDAWAQLAKDAGMKYMVITSKHHDGFALFPSEASDWDIADATPYGKDLIGPLADARARARASSSASTTRRRRTGPTPAAPRRKHPAGKGWDPAQDGDFDEYLDDVAVPQVREILTRYKPDVLWWDTPVMMNASAPRNSSRCSKLCPDIITNNRLERPTSPATSRRPSSSIPATGMTADWETCMTMNRTWGYKSYDHDWKSVETLLRNLVDIASKGGNYLLNVGPKPDGTIPQESIERLHEIGKWMEVNGEAIYGTTASPIKRPAWGRITTKHSGDATTLYLHVFDWPADGKLQVAVTNKAKSARLLADAGRDVKVANSGDEGVTVQLSGDAPDPIVSVVALEIEGAPQPVEGQGPPPPKSDKGGL